MLFVDSKTTCFSQRVFRYNTLLFNTPCGYCCAGVPIYSPMTVTTICSLGNSSQAPCITDLATCLTSPCRSEPCVTGDNHDRSSSQSNRISLHTCVHEMEQTERTNRQGIGRKQAAVADPVVLDLSTGLTGVPRASIGTKVFQRDKRSSVLRGGVCGMCGRASTPCSLQRSRRTFLGIQKLGIPREDKTSWFIANLLPPRLPYSHLAHCKWVDRDCHRLLLRSRR